MACDTFVGSLLCGDLDFATFQVTRYQMAKGAALSMSAAGQSVHGIFSEHTARSASQPVRGHRRCGEVFQCGPCSGVGLQHASGEGLISGTNISSQAGRLTFFPCGFWVLTFSRAGSVEQGPLLRHVPLGRCDHARAIRKRGRWQQQHGGGQFNVPAVHIKQSSRGCRGS